MKTFVDIELDKPRKLRFGYRIAKEMEAYITSRLTSEDKMNHFEIFEYILWSGLREDDNTLQLSDIAELLDDANIQYVEKQLLEALRNDIPELANFVDLGLLSGTDLGE